MRVRQVINCSSLTSITCITCITSSHNCSFAPFAHTRQPVISFARTARSMSNLYAALARALGAQADTVILEAGNSTWTGRQLDAWVGHVMPQHWQRSASRLAIALPSKSKSQPRQHRAVPGSVAARRDLRAAQHRLVASRSRVLLGRCAAAYLRRLTRSATPRLKPSHGRSASNIVLTLGIAGRRVVAARSSPRNRTSTNRCSQRGRSRRHLLHVRHDGSLEGRDDLARQSAVERRCARRALGFHVATMCCCTRCRCITFTACSSHCTVRC